MKPAIPCGQNAHRSNAFKSRTTWSLITFPEAISVLKKEINENGLNLYHADLPLLSNFSSTLTLPENPFSIRQCSMRAGP